MNPARRIRRTARLLVIDEHEREIMRDHRWFTRAELAAWDEPVFPPEILTLLDREAVS